MQSLQPQNGAFDIIVTSLRDLPEQEAMSLLRSLRSAVDPNTLAASLRTTIEIPNNIGRNKVEDDSASQLNRSPDGLRFDDEASRAFRETMNDSPQLLGIDSSAQALAAWLSIPQDARFVDHLLNLYFCWVHPFYQLFARDLFLHDMIHGKTEFCSALLFNALLSLACHYSDRSIARIDPQDSNTAGDSFFAEAKRLLEKAETPSLTTIQALGIMSVRETSHGRDSSGYRLAGRCVRMAVEMGLHLSTSEQGLRPSLVEARRTTFWGVFNVETYVPLSYDCCIAALTLFRLCSVTFGRLSQLPRAAADVGKPVGSGLRVRHGWQPQDHTEVSGMRDAGQAAEVMLFQEHLYKLSELADDMVRRFYAPYEPFTTRRLAEANANYQKWYHSLPDELQLDNNRLPHVLALHMFYHNCVLQ